MSGQSIYMRSSALLRIGRWLRNNKTLIDSARVYARALIFVNVVDGVQVQSMKLLNRFLIL
jgi:hypothetical protein